MKIDRVSLVTELAARRITQTELAGKIGMSRATITRAMNKSCRDSTAEKIAAALQVPLSRLVKLD